MFEEIQVRGMDCYPDFVVSVGFFIYLFFII